MGNFIWGKRKRMACGIIEELEMQKSLESDVAVKKATSSAALPCAKITEDQRQALFKQFWQMDWKEKQTYVNTLIQVTTTARM